MFFFQILFVIEVYRYHSKILKGGAVDSALREQFLLILGNEFTAGSFVLSEKKMNYFEYNSLTSYG